ncbi:hypothetical protein [Actinomadura sp. 6N118]|uniref:hypothetical protein n=1 Tax=Actinomadura sp. 6N118 TaxID=3375151 RepID=UPI0037A8C503
MGSEIAVATGNRLGDGLGLWLGPPVLALALITFAYFIAFGLKKTNAAWRARRRGEPFETFNVPEQGPRSLEVGHEVGGGFYHYSPGIYSHSYSPEEAAAHESEQKTELLPS